MIKIKVETNKISISGHANYETFGKDIVCAAVSSIVITSIEGISLINNKALNVKQEQDKLTIIINSHDDITDKLIKNMLNCLHELEKKYQENIKITNKEE